MLILIVDDDEDLRTLARRILVRAGHSVIEARDGIEGLEMVAARRPDLMLLDQVMPGIDGFEVLRQLRASETGRAIPVIVLTANRDPDVARRIFEIDATDFLAKPFTPYELEARVLSCVARTDGQS